MNDLSNQINHTGQPFDLTGMPCRRPIPPAHHLPAGSRARYRNVAVSKLSLPSAYAVKLHRGGKLNSRPEESVLYNYES